MTTRRQFIHGAAGLGTGLLTGGMPVSWAALPGEARFLLVILRGGLDGLAAFPPYGDPDFAAARGGLALPAPGRPGGAIRLDGRHGMHPSLAPLSEFYEREEMLVLPAVAGPQRTRSHFDAQEVLENGLSHANKGMEGWLNRALGHLQSGPDRLGLAIGYDVPLVLWGGVPVASWAPARLPPSDATLLDKVERLYARDALFAKALKEGRTAKKMAGKVMDGSMKKGRGNLRSPGRFAALAAAAGRFLAEPAGTRIAVLEMGGWDTHANQGVSEGRLARNLAPLADGLVQCRSQLGPACGWAGSMPVPTRPRLEPYRHRRGDRIRAHRPDERHARDRSRYRRGGVPAGWRGGGRTCRGRLAGPFSGKALQGQGPRAGHRYAGDIRRNSA